MLSGTLASALVAALLLAAAGCAAPSSAPAPAPPGPSTVATSPGSPSSGLVRRPDRSVEASGYVGFSDLEGGFWALYDRPQGPATAAQPKTIVVLLPGTVPETAIAALKGSRVVVTGRLRSGVSIRQSGP